MPEPDQDRDDLDLAELRERLQAELESISAAIGELTKPPETGASLAFGKRIGEGTTEAITRFTDVGVANELASSRADLQRALEKLEQGSYGICDGCGEPIPAARLRAMPGSALCIPCAQAAGH